MTAVAQVLRRTRRPRAAIAVAERPIEHRMLLTATMCLLAFGAVMVYSASSPQPVLAGRGDGTGYLIRYLIYGTLGVVVMRVLARRGLDGIVRLTPLLLVVSFGLLLAVLAPGIGVQVNGARRWVGTASLQFQPSELMKLALVLYGAHVLAGRAGGRRRTIGQLAMPVVVVAAAACALVAAQPDLGTALVLAFTVAALLIAAGVPLRWFAVAIGVVGLLVVLFIVIEPYRRARLTSFLDPWANASGSGFQAVQGQIAVGSGGLFGVGLGQGVEKAFYLPEAHTDFILAVIGEELGFAGVVSVLALYGMIAWAGLRTARRATGAYAKLLAAGLTSIILCQAILNIFVVLGLAPLTGVPLPFISYGSTNLVVLLASMGLLLNIAGGGTVGLRAVPAQPRARRPAAERERAAADRDRRRRDGGARRARADRRRRAAG